MLEFHAIDPRGKALGRGGINLHWTKGSYADLVGKGYLDRSKIVGRSLFFWIFPRPYDEKRTQGYP